MVTTRWSSARAALMAKVDSKPNSTINECGNTKAVDPVNGVCALSSSTLNPSQSTLNTVHPESSSDLNDLSLLPPSTGNTPDKAVARITRKPESKNQHTAPRRQTNVPERAFALRTGSAHNPVSLLEDLPLLKNRPATKQKPPEPHQFIDRYSKVYGRMQKRARTAPMPANGSAFADHSDRDVFRMSAVTVAYSGSYINDKPHTWNEAALERQCALPAPYPMEQSRPTDYLQSSNGGYEAQMVPILTNLSGPLEHETMLSRKAVQYMTEYPRPLPRKRQAGDDLHHTLMPEPEIFTHRDTPFSSPGSSSTHVYANKSKSRVDKTSVHKISVYTNGNSQIIQLTEHTALLTSLLQAYPYSTDQERLREDIITLASVQNRYLLDWVTSESQTQRRRGSDSAIDLSSEPELTEPPEEARQQERQQELALKKMREQDDKVRGYLSSHSNIWQNDLGMGLADVFGDASTPLMLTRDRIRVESDPSKIVEEGDLLSTVESDSVISIKTE
jgi:hypothetical protein